MGCTRSKHKSVQIPWPLETSSRQEWIAWKNCFLTFMNEKYVPPYKQGNQLFEYIGNIGLEISKNFYYHNISSETDINTLLFKFDVYFIFGCRKRHNNESIEDYIQVLKMIAEKTGKRNTDRVIKEKILQDMKFEEIFDKFLKIIPSFSKIPDYESLSIRELMFIWEEGFRTMDNKQELIILETKRRDSYDKLRINDCCPQCDKTHQGTMCPAIGHQCSKCGDYNHFSNCCKKTFIMDCPDCGINHIENKCPAYGNECSRCKKNNHFPWQCSAAIKSLCDLCGQNHEYNREKCSAINHICNNCNKIGHYSFKCRSRRNSIKSKKSA